ncbi:wall-associated receptor kinase-like 3 [Prunus yedoensis var. nudiflora]|uniref:Wall-associated receptor kinase-like 3 n=1 Tax=Prunus yedoensis var. nudiflora TaxID=2094558 RepID=A0A314XFJ5_PRUYE|nr:wall-associated receptor kinase-like 3 [Prunus yedoensis var. nudiflora]
MHDKMQYDLLVHLVLFVLLLWSSSTTTAASRAETPMAKRNCPTHCGDISIPYPFGIGPNKDCYFDEWFEMVCNQSSSTSPHKLYLRRAQLEVLNVYANGTLRVNNPIAFFCNGYRGQQPANLSGSPFVYSERHNKFTAVSCDYLTMVSSEKYLVGGCRSICEGTSTSPEDCEIGVNCCQTNIPPHLSVISTDIEDDDRRGRENTCNNYAFLVDQEWFRNNFMASNFSVIKDMDSVPVVLDWSLGLDNTSSRLFQRFIGQHHSGVYEDPTPSCKIQNVTSNSTRQRLVCSCPSGFEGNPYLREPCHDVGLGPPIV